MQSQRDRILRVLTDLVDVILDAQPAKPTESLSRYYDAKTAPCGRRTFLRAAAAGEFPSFREGRKVLARREDVHLWIESCPRTKAPSKSASRPGTVAEIMARHGIVATRRSP